MTNAVQDSSGSMIAAWIGGRARRMLTRPATEWATIQEEGRSTAKLSRAYALILAAVPALAVLAGMLIAAAQDGASVLGFIIKATISIYLIVVLTPLFLGICIGMTAPAFGGKRDVYGGLVMAIYAFTPVWVSGVVLAFFPVQVLAWSVLSSLGGLYLLYLGLPVVMGAPPAKALPYAAAMAAVWVLAFLLSRSMAALL